MEVVRLLLAAGAHINNNSERRRKEEVEQAISSLLEKLRSPTSSTLAQKRKLTKNNPPTGCKKGKGAAAAEPQSITPESRLREFPDEYLRVSSGRLFCCTCREVMSVKKSVNYSAHQANRPTEQQANSLEDYIETSIMLQYNYR